MRSFATVLFAAVATFGCAEGVCTLELTVFLAPRDTTITVGESFKPRLSLSGCGGRKQFSDQVTWRSENVAVAPVDSVTGRITGVAPGETEVRATGERYGDLGNIRVVVAPE